ncbi:MAG: hypothetical protein F6J94_30935 [Moorea sp. SIO1F2]|nr:hypothetical protein [Moorena sp. SIO1F2]
MAYTITKASNPMSIEEREYETAKEVKFTKFTSCIGVLAMVDKDKVRGIHLAINDPQDNKITEKDLTQVINLVPANSSQVKVIGEIEVWKRSVKKVYDSLLEQLKKKSLDVQEYPFGSGVYGGKVEDGKIEITY